jgi:hypothetical protein
VEKVWRSEKIGPRKEGRKTTKAGRMERRNNK